MKTFIKCCSCVVLLLFAVSAHAQIGAGPGNGSQGIEEPPVYMINMLYVASSPKFKGEYDVGFGMWYRTDSEDYRVNATPSRMTRTIQYKGSSNMVFFDRVVVTEEQTVVKNGKTIVIEEEVARKPMLKVNLGSPGKKLILVSRSADGVISGNVMELDAESFPNNSVCVMNYSEQPVKAKIGSSALDIAPMSKKDVKLDSKKVRFLVELTMAGHNGESLYLIEKTRMAMRQGGRKMLLLFPKARNPEELTYSMFTIVDQPFRANYSDKELKPADIPEYDRAYIRFEDR